MSGGGGVGGNEGGACGSIGWGFRREKSNLQDLFTIGGREVGSEVGNPAPLTPKGR